MTRRNRWTHGRHALRRVFVIEWRDLPQPLRDIWPGRERFTAGTHVELHSVLKPREMTAAGIRAFRAVNHPDFQGGMAEFVDQHGLHAEDWVASSGFDLSDVDAVLVRVSH